MGFTKAAKRQDTINQLMEQFNIGELQDLQQTPIGTRFRIWSKGHFGTREEYMGAGTFTQIRTLEEEDMLRIIQDTENVIGYGILDKCRMAEFELDSGVVITSDKCSRWVADENVPSHAGLQILR